MGAIGETLLRFWESTGIANFGYQNGIMILAYSKARSYSCPSATPCIRIKPLNP